MNPELVERALAKVEYPEILINLVGLRVYQLIAARPASRPLIKEPGNLQQLDIALLEIIEGVITAEQLDSVEITSRAEEAPASSIDHQRY